MASIIDHVRTHIRTIFAWCVRVRWHKLYLFLCEYKSHYIILEAIATPGNTHQVCVERYAMNYLCAFVTHRRRRLHRHHQFCYDHCV